MNIKQLYKTLNPIETLGIVIPPNTTVELKFQIEHDKEHGWFEFLGLYSGLTKIIKMDEVKIIEDINK